MKKFPLVFDLETKHTFRDFTDPKKLGITVAAIFNYEDNEAKVFTEKEVSRLFPIFEKASYIIGYNVRNFDLAVLQAYYPGRVEVFPTFDILEDIKEKICKRISLNYVISATLAKKKTGHGLQAIDLFKEGKIDELKKYCLADVMLTKELFEYGVKKGEIFYLNEKGKVTIKVDWKKYLKKEKTSDTPLTLPF